MAKLVARRLLGLPPLLLLISAVCFGLMHAIPGGPVGALAENPTASADDIARLRANFGLDKPLPVQYGIWLNRVLLHGDLGRSYVTGEPVLRMIATRLPATMELMGSAFVIALLVAVFLGVVGALAPLSRWDSFLTIATLVIISVPVFWSGLMAIMLFSVKLRLLPSAGIVTIGSSFSIVDHLKHLAMPSLVLALVFAAGWSRYLRASMSEVMTNDFVRVARAKGLSDAVVALRHGLRPAAAPLVTVVALSLPMLFTGSIIIETLFAWPGMGRLFYEGLLRSDYPRLMGVVLIASCLIAVLNLIADCVYGLLDPRTREA